MNPNGNHWNFIHVKMQEKQIELWDLLGLRASNAKYLAATEKFVKDALIRETMTGGTGDNHSRQWGWESTDRSRDSPRQGNGYDCGIFTLTSMCLIRNGLRLSREAYTQGTITLKRARRRLAARIWEMGVNSGATRWSPRGDTTTTRSETSPAGRATGPMKRRRAEGRGTEGRLTLGNKALRRRWRGRGTDKPHKEEGRGSKRSAKSEAEEEGDDRTRMRLFQPPPKRSRNLIAGR